MGKKVREREERKGEGKESGKKSNTNERKGRKEKKEGGQSTGKKSIKER